MNVQPYVFFGLLCLCSMAAPVLAADGDIVLSRDVQPRVATRPPLVPDPNPTVVNVDPHQQINRQTQGIERLGELSDSDFASINSGLSLPNRLLGTDNPQALPSTQQHQQGIGSLSHGNGAVSSGIAGQINRSVQQGLRPLQNLNMGNR
ncbi:MAG: hypothetical protein ACRCTL_06090 [Pseudomonas sp.]